MIYLKYFIVVVGFDLILKCVFNFFICGFDIDLVNEEIDCCLNVEFLLVFDKVFEL